MLFSWPLISLFFYLRMTVIRATLWSILGAYLILPTKVEVDFPFIPPLDKVSLSNVAAFLACRYVVGKRIVLIPQIGSGILLVVVYIVSPFLTAALNQEPIIVGPFNIKGLEYYDALSSVIRQLIFILPFLLGF